ncbi:MAG: magnesium transporter [Deltaproteobacteria bacterium]|nr:magnesium transporter [Deltaproteobacteria bacterium]
MQFHQPQKEQSLAMLKELIEQNREFDIIDLFSKLHHADVAGLIDNLEEQEKRRLFALLDVEMASDVILELSDHSREQILSDISDERLADMVEEMDTDDAADFVADLPKDQAKAVLEDIHPDDSEDIRELLEYDEDTAGGIMQSELIAVPQKATINDALHAVVEASQEIDRTYNVYVVDEKNRLLGAVPLQNLITSKRHDPIMGAIDTSLPSVNPEMDQEEVARIFRKYDLVSVPVVDREGHLIGRITVDDIVDVFEEESSEDLYRIAGLDEDDHVFNSPWESIKKRLPWLYINLLTAFVSVFVIGFFEDTLKTMVTLALFMPVVAGLGGNAGGQTLALIVRGLALGEITMHNARRALLRQILVGIANGAAVGVVVGFIAYLLKGSSLLGIVLGLAMIINVFVGTLMGTLVPLALKILKLDPALGSNIFITAFTDAFGFLSFLGLATIFLKMLA